MSRLTLGPLLSSAARQRLTLRYSPLLRDSPSPYFTLQAHDDATRRAADVTRQAAALQVLFGQELGEAHLRSTGTTDD